MQISKHVTLDIITTNCKIYIVSFKQTFLSKKHMKSLSDVLASVTIPYKISVFLPKSSYALKQNFISYLTTFMKSLRKMDFILMESKACVCLPHILLLA